MHSTDYVDHPSCLSSFRSHVWSRWCWWFIVSVESTQWHWPLNTRFVSWSGQSIYSTHSKDHNLESSLEESVKVDCNAFEISSDLQIMMWCQPRASCFCIESHTVLSICTCAMVCSNIPVILCQSTCQLWFVFLSSNVLYLFGYRKSWKLNQSIWCCSAKLINDEQQW